MKRFFEKLTPGPGCWEWQAGYRSSGYGGFHTGGKERLAHRVMWEMAFGDIPEGMVIMHSCDNRRCVNPEHLSLGSHAENMKDMVDKGRSAKGEKSWTAKLTEADVCVIRRRKSLGESVFELAKEYGVHRSTVYRLCSGDTWSHV